MTHFSRPHPLGMSCSWRRHGLMMSATILTWRPRKMHIDVWISVGSSSWDLAIYRSKINEPV